MCADADIQAAEHWTRDHVNMPRFVSNESFVHAENHFTLMGCHTQPNMVMTQLTPLGGLLGR